MTPRIPTNNEEKRQILIETRKLINDPDNWTQGYWKVAIDGVQKYCLYGAIEEVMGLHKEDSRLNNFRKDEIVSECSLTTALYEVLDEHYQYMHEAPYKNEMVEALQSFNDTTKHEMVLQLLDDAIDSLK